MLTAYLSLGRRPGGDWADTWHWTERSTVFFFKQEVVHIFFLIAFLEDALVRNTIIILRTYILIIIMQLTITYRRLEDHILLLKIVMGTRKNFFNLYRQSRHAPSKSFASPGIRPSNITGPICRQRQRLNIAGCCPKSHVWWFFLNLSQQNFVQ